MGLHDEAKLDVKFTDFAKQMNLYLNHFPKHEKYGLSQVIRNKAYEVYGFIVESQKRYQKRTSLGNARHTGSYAHLLQTLKGKYHDLFDRLPSRCGFGYNPQPQTA